MIKQQYNPVNVVPDKDPKRVDVSELIDALNMRVGTSNPLGGSGVYKIAGNAIITNPLLPITGTNKAVGWCADRVNKRLYFANWNSVDANDTIYEYSNASGFQIVLRANLGFSSSTLLSMDYNAGYLVWTSSDIEEPRQVDIQRGINTFLPVPVDPRYQLPIQEWELYQIQRAPKTPLNINNGNLDIIYNTVPKPNELSTDTGYQFTYNYEFINNIEGRVAPPTPVYWNPSNTTISLGIPLGEIPYLIVGVDPNPYVVAIRYYFRVGNTGDWVYFFRAPLVFPFAAPTISDFQTLSAIGSTSTSALLGADGVPRKAEDLIFADSRLLLAGLTTGYNIDVLPTATLVTEYLNDTDLTVNSRLCTMFAPLNTQNIETALIYFDEQDRIIGGKVNPIQTLTRTDQVEIALEFIELTTPGYFNTNTRTFKDVWDFGNGSGNGNLSSMDLRNNPAIKITPNAYSGGLPAPIAKVMLATKPQKGYSSFLRTQSRLYLIYSLGDKRWVVNKSQNQSFFVNVPGTGSEFEDLEGQWTFYGIGFEMNSSQPINFSTEQNYHIQIRSISTIDALSTVSNAFFQKDFKISEQIGSLLICKNVPFSQIANLFFLFSNINFANPQQPDYRPYYNWTNSVADILLYSKDNSDKQWQLVPSVNWDRAAFISQTPKYYYGDAYITKDEKTLEQSQTRNLWFYWVFAGPNPVYIRTTDYGKNLSPITCQATVASMNLNGIYQENWSSNVGNVVVIDQNPREQVLSSSVRHSEQALLGTKINNIFTFDPLNQTNTQSQLGPIVKMVLLAVTNNSGNNIYVWCKSGVEMIYLGRTQQTGTDGDSVMSLSTNVFGSHNVLKGDYGIGKKTQAVMTNKGIAFGFDVVKNILVQLSNNGLDPVSDQKYFKSHALDLGVNSIIGYDPFFREVLVKDNIEGIAYNFESDFFQGRRSYNLDNELFAWLTDNQNTSQLFSLLDGELYEFNTGIQIHGLDFTSMVTSVLNIQPELNKELFSVKYSGSAGWKAIITNLKGQLSTIQIAHFQSTNGVFDGSVKRDENSTGGLISGERMEDVVQFISLQDEDSTPKQIVSIEASFIIAQTNLK